MSVWHGHVAATPADPGIGFRPEVELVAVPSLGDRTLTGLLNSFVWLRQLKKHREAIVHAHSSVAGVLVRMLCLGDGGKLVYTPHAFSLVRTDLSYTKRIFLTYLERVLDWVSPSIIVACSDSEAEVIRCHVPRAEVDVVVNGLKPRDRVGVDGSRLVHMPLRVVTVGRVSVQKNHEDLIFLKTHYPQDLDVRVVGGGDAEAVDRLRAVGVEVTGWVDSEKVDALLQRSDVFVQTSLWEGMPVSVMEAMAVGLPVIARDAVGSRDLVKHGKTGLVYRQLDELPLLIAGLNTEEYDWQSMRCEAHALVCDQHSPHRMHLGYLSIYSEG